MPVFISKSHAAAGAVSGDLSGTLPSPTVTKLRGRALADAAPSGDQFYVWDASESEFRFAGTVTNEFITVICPDGVTRRVRLLTP